MPDTVAIRKRLARKGLMACPKTLNYMLDSEAHVKAAMSRYSQGQTVKCKGGMKKICSRYRHFKLTDTDAYKRRC